MLLARLYVVKYIMNFKEDDIKKAQSYFTSADSFLDSLSKEVKNKDMQSMVLYVIEDKKIYDENLQIASDIINERQKNCCINGWPFQGSGSISSYRGCHC